MALHSLQPTLPMLPPSAIRSTSICITLLCPATVLFFKANRFQKGQSLLQNAQSLAISLSKIPTKKPFSTQIPSLTLFVCTNLDTHTGLGLIENRGSKEKDFRPNFVHSVIAFISQQKRLKYLKHSFKKK